MRKTKIICTMGPNENDEKIMLAMAEKMDVARFNFSHGDYEEHKGRLELLKKARKITGRPIAALLDTKGPEIRTGVLEGGKKVALQEGQTFTLTIKECVGNNEKVFINYTGLNTDVMPGNHILIDDGLIDLEVVSVNSEDIVCTVISGGELGEKKGVNVPGVSIKLPSLTEKDISDIKFGIREGFDMIAASFVRDAQCIRDIRKILDENGANMLIIAKIENQEGIKNLDDIIEAADGIMVARGDMGVEIAPQKLPHIQKDIIQKCNKAGKLVVTATQMLDSMIRNPRPTRAEVTDVANAVYDGTDAVMLSGESAMGKYPVVTLNMMSKIVEETEKYLDYASFRTRKVNKNLLSNIANAVCFSSVATASDLNAAAIIAPTVSGSTARMISKYRPSCRIAALSPSMSTVRQMMLFWGVTPVWSRRAESTDEMIEDSISELKNLDLVEDGDIAVVTAGLVSYDKRHESVAATNMIRVVEI